jgi:hypothetical protein
VIFEEMAPGQIGERYPEVAGEAKRRFQEIQKAYSGIFEK